jgi:hypothetical protein
MVIRDMLSGLTPSEERSQYLRPAYTTIERNALWQANTETYVRDGS